MHDQKPWLRHYGSTPASIDYPAKTLYEMVRDTAERHPDRAAWHFLGREATYREFLADIDRCAAGLASLGLVKGDRITISMPTSPQGIIPFYAANKLGVVCSMIHPLSTAPEIEFYLNLSRSKVAITLDAFYGVFREVLHRTPVETLVLAKIQDYLPFPKNVLFPLTKGRKIPKVPPDSQVRWLRDLMTAKHPPVEAVPDDPNEMAVILYSGGTTGTPKGIMLSNHNFVAEGLQCASWIDLSEGSMLAILPIFHGFGLGVCVNAMFLGGGTAVLVPIFQPDDVAKLIRKHRPALMVGVPTLYDALVRDPVFQKTDLSCLRGAFCGADHLPRPVKEAFETAVRKSGGEAKLLEGYGLTEAVTAIMAMPMREYRERSIGVPFPDMLAKVVTVGTTDEAPVGEEGEICLSGPAVMLGYLDQPEETADTLKTHADGRVWLHTGDIGTMDEDGFFYFKLRLKRMIKSSGMNVYPAQVEEHLVKHPAVDQACVIGVPDRAQVERVKAFVVLKDPAQAGPDMEKQLVEHCRGTLIKWSCPREIEFREELPKTLVGKVSFRALEEEELERLRTAGEYTGE